MFVQCRRLKVSPPPLTCYCIFNYCDFTLKDLKANESRLKDINKVAEDLESEGLMAEEVQAVQQQVGVLILAPEVTFFFSFPPLLLLLGLKVRATTAWQRPHLVM